MWRLLLGGGLALLTACGEAPDPVTPEELCDFSGTAAYGTGHVELGPVRARIGATRAGAWSTSSNFGALTVIDAFTVDGEGRPLGELFILYNDAPRTDTVPLVPATLAQLHSIPPDGSFAFIAEGYDPVVGDYDRWLVSGGGCLVIDQVVENDRIVGRLKIINGEWRTKANQLLGKASVTAYFTASLVTLLTPTSEFRDSVRATLSGGRNEIVRAMTVDAFQVLHPDQTRLVIAGFAPLDTTRELWLSVPGVPITGDSIAFDAVSVDQALTGRAGGPFAMLRMTTPGPTATITEIWPSTGGWVKFDRVVQNGPAALCGAAWGRFEFDAQGTRLASGGSRTSLGSMQVREGRFAARFTPLMPTDTVGDPTRPPASPLASRRATASMASLALRLTPSEPASQQCP